MSLAVFHQTAVLAASSGVAATVIEGPGADGLITLRYEAPDAQDVVTEDGHERARWITSGGYEPQPSDEAVIVTDSLGDPWALVATPVGAATPVAVLREAPLNVDDPRFDGSLPAAIDHLGTGGGHIVVPVGDRDIGTTQINLDDRLDVTIEGEGSRYGKARLVSHLTGGGSVISARSTGGFRMAGLSVYNDQASFTGKLLDLSRRSGGPQDTGLFTISDCLLQMITQASSGAVGISLNNALSGAIEGVYFIGGKNAIRGRETAGDFSNSMEISGKCYFQGQDAAAIVNPFQSWLVSRNTFEPCRDGRMRCLSVDSGVNAYGLWIEHNWTGDASVAGGVLFGVEGYGISIERNLLNGAGQTGVKLTGFCQGLSINRNVMSGLATGIDCNGVSVLDLEIGINHWESTTARVVNFSTGGQTEPLYVGQGAFQHNLVAAYGDATQVRIGNRGGVAGVVYWGPAEDTALFRSGANTLGGSHTPGP